METIVTRRRQPLQSNSAMKKRDNNSDIRQQSSRSRAVCLLPSGFCHGHSVCFIFWKMEHSREESEVDSAQGPFSREQSRVPRKVSGGFCKQGKCVSMETCIQPEPVLSCLGLFFFVPAAQDLSLSLEWEWG